MRGLDDDVELEPERAAAFLQLVFVFEPRVEAFEVGSVPHSTFGLTSARPDAFRERVFGGPGL